MPGADTTTFQALLKEVYEPKLNVQLSLSNPLLSEIESTDEGVIGGKYTVIALQMDTNNRARPASENAQLPDPGATRPLTAKLDLTFQYSGGAVSGPSLAKSRTDAQSFARIIDVEMKGVRDGMRKSLGRQVWHGSDGTFARAGTVTGSGPYVVAIDQRIIEANWVDQDTLLQTAPAPSGGTVTPHAGDFLVTAVDRTNFTITLAVNSGSPTVTSGDYLLVSGSANQCLQGLPQIINEQDTFQGVNGAVEGRWNACIDSVSAAWSIDHWYKLRSKTLSRSGKEPNLVITTKGIERAAVEDLRTQVRYQVGPNQGPDDLRYGMGVILPGDPPGRLRGDVQAPAGKVWGINTDELKTYQDGDFEFLKQGGDIMLRFGPYDTQYFYLKKYFQVGCTQRTAMGRIDGVTDATVF